MIFVAESRLNSQYVG